MLTSLLLVWLSLLWDSNSNVANDFVCRFRPMKPVPLQDPWIFRIHILLNFEILILHAYLFQSSEGLEGLKECTLVLIFHLRGGAIVLIRQNFDPA